MASNSHDPVAKSHRTASPPLHKKAPGFSALNPAAMGFDMPDWLAPSGSPVPSPADAALPSDPTSHSPQSLPEIEQELPVSTHPEPRTLLEGMKVVCICKGIKKRIFWQALDSGAQTKDDVNRLTGSGNGGCQGRRCGPRILEMLRNRGR
jgi:bacterioferritin-associated ferredoxin